MQLLETMSSLLNLELCSTHLLTFARCRAYRRRRRPRPCRSQTRRGFRSSTAASLAFLAIRCRFDCLPAWPAGRVCISSTKLSWPTSGETSASHEAIRSVVKTLRSRLRQAGMKNLADAIDGSVPRHYARSSANRMISHANHTAFTRAVPQALFTIEAGGCDGHRRRTDTSLFRGAAP